MDRKIVPIHSPPIQMLGRGRDMSKISIILSREAPSLKGFDQMTIRVFDLPNS